MSLGTLHPGKTTPARTFTPEVVPGEFSWLPDWSGRTVIVLASGPSAKDVDLSIARGVAPVICVNESYRLAPWADALYGCDARWWKARHGVEKFKGIRISQDRRTFELYPEIKRVNTLRGVNEFRFDNLGYIGWFGNGGMQVVNLVAQLQPKRIVLVGLDMTILHGHHWHGMHSNNLPNPRETVIEGWRFHMDRAAPAFAERGIEVVKTSDKCALQAYPKMELWEALCP